MPTTTPTAPLTVLPAEVAALRADLTSGQYTAAAVEALLGPVASAALGREDAVPARRVLAARPEPAAALMRLFTLGEALPRAEVEAILPTLGVGGASALGLLGPAPDGRLRALMDLAPYSARDDRGEIDWWIVSDLSELATGRPLGPEHVLGVGGASLTLARLTPRTPVGRVLDLGCGGGIQAMHASRHAEHVVATDLSERALGVAAFNAALNGIDLELRHGSLLEPVAGEAFDLVVSNPPFVITPRPAQESAQSRWTYRDGGRAGDTLLAELLHALPAHLAPGGTAVMLGNWEIPAGADWDAHPRAWLSGASADGVDAWVLQREQEDPAQYAGTWARDGGVTPRDPRWAELVGAWLDDFAARDVSAIGFGYVLLRRPAGDADRPGQLRTEQVPGTGSGTLSEHLAASLRALDELAALDDEELAALRPVRAADVVERRHLTPGEWDPMLIELVQGAGFARTVPADQLLAATVGALDGTLTLGQVLGAVCALTDADEAGARARVLPAVRELVRTGMVTL